LAGLESVQISFHKIWITVRAHLDYCPLDGCWMMEIHLRC
jgi:hypothetical protein